LNDNEEDYSIIVKEEALKKQSITRRQMLKMSGAISASALLAACASKVGGETAQPTTAVQPTVAVKPTDAPTVVPTQVVPTSVTLDVYNPTGAFEVTQLFAPRLDTLDGKTICEITDDNWQSTRTFPLIREALQKQYPNIKIITYDKLPTLSMGSDVAGLEAAVKKLGAQGAIVGNAG
jgi:hypothetical protein